MKSILYINLISLLLWPVILVLGIFLFGASGEIENPIFKSTARVTVIVWLLTFFILFFLSAKRAFETRAERSSTNNLLLVALAFFGTVFFPYVVCYITRSSFDET